MFQAARTNVICLCKLSQVIRRSATGKQLIIKQDKKITGKHENIQEDDYVDGIFPLVYMRERLQPQSEKHENYRKGNL